MAEATDSQASQNEKEEQKEGEQKLTFAFLNEGRTTYAEEDTGPSTIISYPSALKTISGEIDYIMFRFKIYAPPFKIKSSEGSGSYAGYNNSALNLKDDTELPTVIMYVPEDMQAEYGTDWGAKSIQNVTASILRGVSAKKDITDLFKGIQDATATGFDAADIKITKTALKALQDNGQGEGLGVNDILGSTRGVIVNPNTELLFNGFDLRRFDLNFKMVANNQAEAQEIRDIITSFKMAMLPRLDERKSANDQDTSNIFTDKENVKGVDRTSFIGVPDLVDIKIMHGSSEHPFISQWKPCAITSLNVNYTADGSYATYQGGEPVAVTMTLGLSEIKLIYREDIRFGGASF